jgi:hypothetical protein
VRRQIVETEEKINTARRGGDIQGNRQTKEILVCATETFEDAAKAMKQSAEDAKKNARQLLDKVINAKEQSSDKNWKP